MEDQVVLYRGLYWSKDDGSGVTEETAATDSSCYGLTVLYPNVPSQIASIVPERKVMVQAGGNAGFYVKQYAAMFDTVYTFEPVPVLFYCLNRNVTSDNVFKFQACLGNTHEGVSIGRRIDNNAGSGNVVSTGMTPTMKIDDLALPRCDLIHLDIEGYELKALQGAFETIRRCRPVIAFEDHAPWLARFNTSVHEIDAFLKALGYSQTASVSGGDRVYTHTKLIPWMKL